jgi:hypothetical protein
MEKDKRREEIKEAAMKFHRAVCPDINEVLREKFVDAAVDAIIKHEAEEMNAFYADSINSDFFERLTRGNKWHPTKKVN